MIHIGGSLSFLLQGSCVKSHQFGMFAFAPASCADALFGHLARILAPATVVGFVAMVLRFMIIAVRGGLVMCRFRQFMDGM